MLNYLKRTNPEDAASGSGSSQNRRRIEDINLGELPADPGLHKPIKDYHPNVQEEVRRAYLQKGPCQPRGHQFPQTLIGDKLRRFNVAWFEEHKDWLEYSIKEDGAFCLYCYLFKPGGQAGGDVFVTKGFKNWKSKTESFRKHVGAHNSSHNIARKSCEELMNPKQSIIKKLEKSSEHSRREYRTRLFSSLTAIRYLLAQGLAFRGNDESEDSLNKGNFLQFLKYLSKTSEEIRSVVLRNAPENHKLTSTMIQKDIVSACATETTNVLVKEIGDSFFSIMVDESRDISIKEQMAIVVRFVDDRGHVMERFLGVVHVCETSAATLKEGLVALLAKYDLSLARLRGQGYDGAGNMRGEFNGLQAKILSENECAYYVHCFAHQLQLALVALVKNHPDMDVFFFHINTLTNLIGASCKRLEIFREKECERIAKALEAGEIESGRGLNQERTLSRPGETRWSSHYKSLVNVIALYSSVIEVLEIIHETESGKRGEAKLLLGQLVSFEFVFCLHMITKILGVTNDLCQALQKKDQDIVNAISLVKVVKERLQELRNDEHEWDVFLFEVSLFCEIHKIDVPDMEEIYEGCPWRRRKAERITNSHHYRVELFKSVIDMQYQELNNRFNEVNMELLLCMSCLSPVGSFSTFDKRKLIRLAEFYPKDFSESDRIILDNQLETYVRTMRSRDEFSDLKGISDLAKKMVETKLHDVFSLVYKLLKLALTLPVAIASVERAFSAMNIVKSRLRNRIGDEWLNDALITYIERDVFEMIDDDVIMTRFQNMKTRRGQL